MKKLLCALYLLGALCALAFADEERDSVTGFGLDFALTGRNNDFALSTAVSSPWLFRNSLGFRVNTDYFVPSRVRNDPYGFFALDCAVMGGHLMRTANIRLYGGGGPLFLFPLKKSEAALKISGEGFFGFEFFMDEKPAGMSLFTEIGGGGFGFHAKAGMRWTFPMGKKSM